MGTSMEMIQNAYQGFSKQNFTLLDNLKLGYGGTKEEMERLLEDAEKLPGALGRDFDISNYADIVDAIHLVQDSMGIAGATAAEAESTIQGSLSAAKSAWSNLVTGIGDENADLDTLVNNFVESVSTAGENIIPRIEQILIGIGEAVTKLAPILGEQVPGIIVSVLPTLIDAGTQLFLGLITGIMTALPQLVAAIPNIISTFVTAIGENLPAIAEAGGTMLSNLVNGIVTGIPVMIEKLPEVIDGFLNFITEHLPDVLDKGVEILSTLGEGIINGITLFVQNLPEIITSFVTFIVENLPKIVDAGIRLIKNLAIGIIKAIPELVKALPKIIVAIVEGIISLLGMIADVGKRIIQGLWEGIKSAIGWLTDKIKGFFTGIVDGIKGFLGIKSPSRLFAGIGENMALGLGKGWDNEYASIKKDIESGMDFGTGTVDFSASRLKTSIAGAANSVSSAVGGDMNGVTIPITLELDGEVLARKTHRYNQQESARVGYAMVRV